MISVLISVVVMLRGVVRSRVARHLEVLALRHQLQVLQWSRPRRLHLTKADRWLWASLSRAWTGWRTALAIVKPETVVAWHRQGFRVFWALKSRGRTGRPAVAADVRALIWMMTGPESRAVMPPSNARVIAIPQVGGLHRRYEGRAT